MHLNVVWSWTSHVLFELLMVIWTNLLNRKIWTHFSNKPCHRHFVFAKCGHIYIIIYLLAFCLDHNFASPLVYNKQIKYISLSIILIHTLSVLKTLLSCVRIFRIKMPVGHHNHLAQFFSPLYSFVCEQPYLSSFEYLCLNIVQSCTDHI